MPVRALLRALKGGSASAAPSVPAGRRIYAIGDVHGRHDLVVQLVRSIYEDHRARSEADLLIIFLGDLVDRGPDSAAVIDELISLKDQGVPVRCLLGNHDAVLLRALEGDPRSTRYLVRMGGRPTLISYGISEDEYGDLDYDALTARLQALAPPTHLEFLHGMERLIEAGDYVFVHAGLRPGVPLDAQSGEDLCWIREDFLRHQGQFDRFVIHGHSITEDADVRANRIGIDTGAYDSGRLTAIGLEGEARWFLTT